MHWLLQADKQIFNIINNKWHNSIFDSIMPYLRNSIVWLPLYLFIVVFVIFNFKNAWWFVLFAIFTAIVTDFISSDIIKNVVFRFRPCRDPEMIDHIRFLVTRCPVSSGFTSSHAANHFGLATFLSITLFPFFNRWIYLFYLWAVIICYAQIYVGVHYPLDVIAGGFVGILAGLMTAKLFKNKVPNFDLR
ncbi:MAG: phosphatase PAP2 family protein [Chitinophagaceae bacterium]|nr:phosphatase PAP2 family protein [Chitinophagaceae bacterium]